MRGREERVLVVASEIPGHAIAFEKSGHGEYLRRIIEHFRRRDCLVTLIALRPSATFVVRRMADVPFTITSPRFAEIAKRYVVRSPGCALRALAWGLLAPQPAAVKLAVSNVRRAMRRRRGFDHVLGAFPTEAEAAYAREVAERLSPDVVLYDSVFNYIPALAGASHWIVTHDVKHERAASFASRGYRVAPYGFGAEQEAAILRAAGNAIAIQWQEAEVLRRISGCRIVTVPIPIDPVSPIERAPLTGRGIFVASASLHNVDGLRWFLAECWPAVRACRGDATLDVVGSVGMSVDNVPEGVRVRGVVPDLGAIYAHAAFAVVPLRVGSGLKVKLAEALAHGVPTVSTSVGGQGLLDVEPRPFLLADQAASFAAAVVQILESAPLAETLSSAGRTFAERLHPDRAFDELNAALACA